MSVNSFKKIVIALVTIMAIGIFNSSFAAVPKLHTEIKYVGNSDNLPVFQLELKTSANAVYTVTIRNNEKRILLFEKLKGSTILRRYKLDAEEIGWIEGTTFEVTNKITNETVLYTISGKMIVTENVSDFKNLMRLIETD
ncbi:MAG: hypothetical protein WDO19_22485 [Bacteroidota bacterium]